MYINKVIMVHSCPLIIYSNEHFEEAGIYQFSAGIIYGKQFIKTLREHILVQEKPIKAVIIKTEDGIHDLDPVDCINMNNASILSAISRLKIRKVTFPEPSHGKICKPILGLTRENTNAYRMVYPMLNITDVKDGFGIELPWIPIIEIVIHL